MSVIVPFPRPENAALARRLMSELGRDLHVPADEVAMIVTMARVAGAGVTLARLSDTRHCRVCGCTATTACRDPRTGDPCAWAAPDLCTACAPFVKEPS